MTEESRRLKEARETQVPWRQWGPYLSERQWGTVREDYSDSGNAWDYFSHEQARSRAYVWGEDGLAGISDDKQLLCFALALWNGQDPILKERLFGLTNSEGNHGEDVKEYYYYLDSTPTHSYMRYLYKYPQRAYPYEELISTNRARSRQEPEYELIDTGVFDDNRYFDVFVNYAKASPTDLLIEIEIVNRSREAASLHVLPTLWFRNTWSWATTLGAKPILRAMGDTKAPLIAAIHGTLGGSYLYLDEPAGLLFTENETNHQRVFGVANVSPYVKDGINDYVVDQERQAINPQRVGTKAAAHYQLTVGAGETRSLRLRLTDVEPPDVATSYAASGGKLFGEGSAAIVAARRAEADRFYASITPTNLSADAALVMRQALSGMLWSKQFFSYDVSRWLRGHGADPAVTSPRRLSERNRQWFHLVNDDIISMPDKAGIEGRRLLAALDEQKLRRVLAHMFDENEFLSDYGIRALSRYHEQQPYIFYTAESSYRVDYEPAESSTGLFGGNSNWRGPIWMPVNVLLVRGLLLMHNYYGDEFTVECPTGSGIQMTLFQVAEEISRRLGNIFLRDASGRRAAFGDSPRFQNDPQWRDYLLFYEYFHADTGRGVGASHQTGWTGVIARLFQLFGSAVGKADDDVTFFDQADTR